MNHLAAYVTALVICLVTGTCSVEALRHRPDPISGIDIFCGLVVIASVLLGAWAFVLSIADIGYQLLTI